MVSLRSHLARGSVIIAQAVLLCGTGIARGSDELAAWLNHQASIKTWTAAFTQSRTLSTLNKPLVTRGTIEFAAPNLFRWELGEPPQTIAIREATRMTILYPRLKRAEQYPLDAAAKGPWKDAMALLDAGFPRSRSELEERFDLQPLQATGDLRILSMRPRAASVRKMLEEVRLEFRTGSHELVATQMKFKDGSVLRNNFTNVVANKPVSSERFCPNTDDYKLATPKP